MNWIKNIHSGMFVRVSRRVGVHTHMVVWYKKYRTYKVARPTHSRTHAHGTCHLEYMPSLLYILELYFVM